MRLFFSFFFISLFLGCSQDQKKTFSGLVEKKQIKVVAPFSGKITGINVAAGQEIKKGSNLFSLDEFRISREIEIAKRNLNIKKRNLDYAYKFSGKNRIETAKDDLKIAETSLLEVIWKKKNLLLQAQKKSFVTRKLFSVGDWVNKNESVLQLVNHSEIKIKVWVPLEIVTFLKTGEKLKIQCDSCPIDAAAKVDFISATSKINRKYNDIKFLVELSPEELLVKKLISAKNVNVIF